MPIVVAAACRRGAASFFLLQIVAIADRIECAGNGRAQVHG